MRPLLPILLAAVLPACVPENYDISTKSLESSFPAISVFGPSAMLADQPWIANCSGLEPLFAQSGLARGDDIEVIRAVNTAVVRGMTALPNGDGAVEDWSSFAPEVLLRQDRPRGDCDDFALTAASLAICAGVPADRIEFVLVDSEGGTPHLGRVDHAYAAYRDAEGQRWIFGDLFGPVRKVSARMTEIMWIRLSDLQRPQPAWMARFEGWQSYATSLRQHGISPGMSSAPGSP